MADIIWGAVPQRYPKLRFVLAEGGIGWIASVLGSMDHWWADHRNWMETGWLSRYGKDPVVVKPSGYLAPPLDGIWATGPYLHNGSVPTLWHLLHPKERPVVWRRTSDSFDHERIGMTIEALDTVPASAKSARTRRRYFDTSRPGKSAAGHLFPDKLTEAQKRAVLEFLKPL